MAVLKAQEPGPPHGVASGHWLASSRSTISSLYWIDRTAGRGGIGAGAALAAVVDDLAGLRAIVQAFEGDRGVNRIGAAVDRHASCFFSTRLKWSGPANSEKRPLTS